MKIRHLFNAGKTNPIRTQTNPIKANLKKAQKNVNKVLTKEYEKMSNWALYENKPKTNPIKPNPPSGNQNEEYIELYNITGAPVTLYRVDKYTPWRFTDGIEYTFPASPPVTIPAYGYLLVVKDLSAFTLRYGSMPPGVQVLDDYDGRLSNAGEKVQLSMPGDTDEFGTRYYIRIDRVNYSDGSHPEDCPGGVDFWPTEADGLGKSLTRKVADEYGNDVANWETASPSPGVANP